MTNGNRYIIGNWKMNTSLEEGIALLAATAPSTASVRVGVAPPYPWIVPLHDHLADHDIWLGAQHAVPIANGAYTGDISVEMIAPHVDFVIVGHSEQRQYHPPGPFSYARTVAAAIELGRTAILCVGENSVDRQADAATRTVSEQLKAGLPVDFDPSAGKLIVAYEPVWAIGTGQAASASDAETMASFIDGWFVESYRCQSGDIPLLYGGSVNASNAGEFLDQHHVNGLLIGSASLDSDTFNGIIARAGQGL